MLEATSSGKTSPTGTSRNSEVNNLKKVFSNIYSNRNLFIGSVIAAFLFAYLYNRFTVPVYKVSSAILIEDNKQAETSGNEQLLEGFGLMPGMKNLDNQIMVLSSRNLVNRTLEELDFDIEYYHKKFLSIKPVYPERPISITYLRNKEKYEDIKFRFRYLEKNAYRLEAEIPGLPRLNKKASFGDTLMYNDTEFVINANDFDWLKANREHPLYFILHSRRNLVSSYIDRLVIDQGSRKGSIVRVSIKGTNREKDLVFLEKLTNLFVNISLDKKNSEANRTIKFIDDQMIGISDSLSVTENQLQVFRSRNKVMNLSAQGQAIIDQASNLEIEKGRLIIEANYYSYLSGYIEKDTVGEDPIAPATSGIADPGLSRLVADLADLQSQMYSKNFGTMNPMQGIINQKIENTKDALRETLNGLIRANNLALVEIQDQVNRINERAATLPRTERELLGIERKYKLNDQLYTFLLERRAVAQMQKASNVADNEIVDYPYYENKPVKPNKPFIYFLGLLAGFGFPFSLILIKGIFNTKVSDAEDLADLTDIPVTRSIPHSPEIHKAIVLEEPDSEVTEAFRLLRSKMQFFTKELKSVVILVTSSMAGEGKTFTAVNLASAYTITGKRTVLVEFDMRQPGISHEFGLNNEEGISSWLIGKTSLESIILNTDYDNFQIIPSGPLPPNPAELSGLEKISGMIKKLKERYDFIIIDTPPAGIISDTYPLLQYADVCILVVRENYSIKDIVAEVIKDLRTAKARCLNIVLNDSRSISIRYGYNMKYRYSYGRKTRNNKVFTGIKRMLLNVQNHR